MNSNYYFANRFSMLPNNTDFLPYDINVLKKIQEESERRKRPKLNYSFHTLFSPFIADAVGASPNYDIEAKAVELLDRKKSSVYSYHTFMLPFNIEDPRGKTEFDFESVVEYFKENGMWYSDECCSENGKRKFPFNRPSKFKKHSSAKGCACLDVDKILRTVTALDGDKEDAELENIWLAYQEYQYFNPAMRNALYTSLNNNSHSEISHTFEFRPEGRDKKLQAHYYITRNITYDLHVNAVRVMLFNTGIGIFMLECENHGLAKDGKTSQANTESVKAINEYGRRINLPLLPVPDPERYFSLCADSFDFEFTAGRNADGSPKIERFSDNFKDFVYKCRNTEMLFEHLSLTHVANFITDVLNYSSAPEKASGKSGDSSGKKNEEKTFSSKRRLNSKYLISPALDDRMFVCCCVADTKTAEFYTAANVLGEFNYLHDDKTANSLYEFVFIDTEGKVSCPTAEMRKELLSAHVYKRWLSYGTLQAVTNYSLVCITSESVYAPVILPFLTQYTRLACFALVQRASLIKLQADAALLSAHIKNPKKKINTQNIIALNKLQERFVAFQSQLNLFEVTAQEQGCELYGMLREFLFVDKQREALQNQLDALYSAANTALDTNFNKWAAIFALIALFLSLAGFFADGMGAVETVVNKPKLLIWLIPSAFFVLVLFAVIFPMLYSYRRKR